MTTRRTQIVAVALALTAAVSAPPAGAQGIDLRSPDAAEPMTHASPPVDLRSPDAAEPMTHASPPVDLRSPDAVEPMTHASTPVDLRSPDAAEPYSGVPALVEQPAGGGVEPTGDGPNWFHVGLAGSAVAVLSMLCVAGMRRSRHSRLALR